MSSVLSLHVTQPTYRVVELGLPLHHLISTQNGHSVLLIDKASLHDVSTRLDAAQMQHQVMYDGSDQGEMLERLRPFPVNLPLIVSAEESVIENLAQELDHLDETLMYSLLFPQARRSEETHVLLQCEPKSATPVLKHFSSSLQQLGLKHRWTDMEEFERRSGLLVQEVSAENVRSGNIQMFPPTETGSRSEHAEATVLLSRCLFPSFPPRPDLQFTMFRVGCHLAQAADSFSRGEWRSIPTEDPNSSLLLIRPGEESLIEEIRASGHPMWLVSEQWREDRWALFQSELCVTDYVLDSRELERVLKDAKLPQRCAVVYQEGPAATCWLIAAPAELHQVIRQWHQALRSQGVAVVPSNTAELKSLFQPGQLPRVGHNSLENT